MKRRKFVQHGAAGIIGTASVSFPIMYGPESMKKVETYNIRTPLCELLNIKYPVIQAGMADVAGPALVAAVSNAGGLGILTGTMVAPDILRQRIQEIRGLTDKPFGVNLILHRDLFPPADFEIEKDTLEEVQNTLNKMRKELEIPESHDKPPKLPPLIQLDFEVIVEENVPVFSVGLGNPSQEMVSICHSRGMKVMAMVCTVEDALTVSENGVDIVVAQGSEAGGHRSTWEKKKSDSYASIGTLPLTAAVVSAVKVPVVAAGGIVNGKGLNAAMALGAQGVLVGTRFIATKESVAPESYKQKIIESSSDNTMVTDVFTGMYARVLRNRFTQTYTESNTPVLPPGMQYAATVDIVMEAGKKGIPEYYSLYAGQGIDGIKEIKPAAGVIEELIKEAMEGKG